LEEIKNLNDRIDRLDNEILCSNMADGRAYFDEEPLRKKWSQERSEARARICEIADGRDWIKALYGSE
jgi:hypothetical protein